MGKQLNTNDWKPVNSIPTNNNVDTSNWIPISDPNTDFNIGNAQKQIEVEQAFDASINKMMDELPGLNDAEKKTILDLGKTRQFDVTQMNDFINTFRGANPIQNKYVNHDDKGKLILSDVEAFAPTKEEIEKEGFFGAVNKKAQNAPAILSQAIGQGHYYMKDMGNGTKIPVPLSIGQNAEAGHTVDSIWGSDAEAQDDSRVTDIGKKLFNLIPSTAQGILALGELGQGLTTGKTESAFKVAKQELESYKMATSTEKNKGIIDASKVDEFKDIFSSEIYDLSPDKILNTAVNAGTSILQLLATRGALGFAGTSGKIATTGNYVAGFTTNLAEPLKAADDAGVTGRSKYAVAALYSTLATAVEMKIGIEGKILNKEAQAAKKEMISKLIKDNVNIVDGKITKESVEKLMEETIKKTNGFYAKHGKNILGEASEEVIQNMTQNGIQEIHDNLMKDDPESAKYNTKFWSPKAIAEYMNSAISGAIGGTGGSIVMGNKQSETVYNAIEQGPEKVNELKTDLVSSLKRGKISQDDFNRANFKIDAYQSYYEATKDRPLAPEDKRTIFDLTYQKENLKSSIENLEKNNPGGINDGLIATKKKEVDEITKNVNDIWTKAETKVNPAKEAPAPHWSEKVAEVSKEVGNPSNTITQKLTNNELVNEALGLTPELNNLAKEFEVEFKTPSMTPEMPNIRVKGGQMIIPTETEVKGKEGATEKKIVDIKIPAYAFKDENGESWIFGHNENAAEDKGSSYLIKLNEDGSFDDAQEFKFETTKKNELNMDDLPKVFDTLGLKPIGTKESIFEEDENDAVVHPDEAAFNSAYQSVTSGANTGTISANPNGTYKVNVEGRDVNFASTKHMNLGAIPADGKVNIESGEGEFGQTLLIKNPETGEEIGYLRATPQSKGKVKEDVTAYEDESTVEIPYNLSPEAKTILDKIEKDQENYELVEDDLGRRYVNKKTGEAYSTVSEFVGGTFKGKKGLKETAFGAGKMVSGIVKDFFNGKINAYSNYAHHISRADYDDIINQLMAIKELADKSGYSIITKRPILADDKNKIAGQPEILMVDKEGNFYVYDVSTLKNAKRLNMRDLLNYKYSEASMSNGERISSQVNIYADVLKNKFDVDVNKVGVIPFEIDYTVGTKEKPFMIDYAKQNKRVDFKRKQILKYDNSKGKTQVSGVPEGSGQTESGQKTKAVRAGIKKALQKIKSPSYLKALEFEATNPVHIAMQYFINNGTVKATDVQKLLHSNVEMTHRISYIKKDGKSIKEIAHKLWEDNENLPHDTQVYENAIEEAIRENNSRSKMANEINKAQNVEFTEYEQGLNELFSEAEESEVDEDFTTYIDAYEELSDTEAQKLAEDQEAFESWYDNIRAEEAKKNLDLPPDIVSGKEDQFQKESKQQGDVQKVVDALKKANPKLQIVYDSTLKDKQGNPAAAKVNSKGVIAINPNYAGIDTPIHEVGHILIDAIGGTSNLVIKKAIKQLKDTDLWKEIAKSYPELSEDMLGKEVLAEAIGREGAGIFETEAQKSAFRSFMEYIFDRIKTLLGINKNIAKSLAKEVIAGRYNVPENMEEQFQKKRKKNEQEYYTEKYLDKYGVSLSALKKSIADSEAKLAKDPSNESLQKELEDKQAKLEKFEKSYKKYSFDYNKLNKVKAANNLEGKSIDELLDLYNTISGMDTSSDPEFFADVKFRIAALISEEQRQFLESKGVNVKPNLFKDIKYKDVLMKSLGHMTQEFPELQYLSKAYDTAVREMNMERREASKKLDELGKAVAKENTLGLKMKDFFSGKAYKFFEWMDNGKGELISTDQAYAISKAKGDYMKFYRELKEQYKEIQEGTPAGFDENSVLKTDKGFSEKLDSNGIVSAIQSWLGTSQGMKEVVMKFTSADGKTEDLTFGEIEQKLQKEGENGKISAAQAAAKSAYYNMKAKRLLKKGTDEAGNDVSKYRADFILDRNGKLTNKFGVKRDDEFDYSKDFHAAAVQYINDMTWTKHMQPLVPLVESIEHFSKTTGVNKGAKPNLTKWVQNWKKMHVYQEKPYSAFPELDVVMRTLRNLTSMTSLAFNVGAAKMNFAIGMYNNWREIGGTEFKLAKGIGRLAPKMKGGKRKFSKKAHNILMKYGVVATDYDEKVGFKAGEMFRYAAQGLTKATEYFVQGSLFFGQMSKQEWNDFDADGNYTGSDPNITEKIEAYKKKVSNIHGKYAAKDRRNFELYEFGKFVGQFKTWVPDWWKERFGDEYYDENGIRHKGNWNGFFKYAVKELRKDIVKPEFWTSDKLEYVNARKNLKAAMTLGLLMALQAQGDDDKKRRKKGDFLSQAIGNLTFVFDPNQAKYVLKTPAAGLSYAMNMLDLMTDLNAKKLKKVTPYGKVADVLPE